MPGAWRVEVNSSFSRNNTTTPANRIAGVVTQIWVGPLIWDPSTQAQGMGNSKCPGRRPGRRLRNDPRRPNGREGAGTRQANQLADAGRTCMF